MGRPLGDGRARDDVRAHVRRGARPRAHVPPVRRRGAGPRPACAPPHCRLNGQRLRRPGPRFTGTLRRDARVIDAAGTFNRTRLIEVRCPSMRRILVIALLAFAVAPVAASVAAGGPNATTNASASCTALKAKMGATTFAQAYTSFGRCVSALTSVEQANIAAATAACTAEQSDANFAATHSNKTFAQFYGTGKSGKDAFNKCVSAKTQASSKVEQQART